MGTVTSGGKPAVRWIWRAALSAAALGLLAAVSAAVSAGAPPARAAEILAQAAQQRSFDIPTQPLPSALPLFGQQAGIQISADGNLVRDLRTAGVSGTMTVETALRQLLAGTGLVYRFAADNTVTLARAAAQEDEGPMRLGPVTVTGERIERTVLDTPTSVAVVTGEEIERTPAFNDVEDVLDAVPNIVTGGTSFNGATIRGIDTTGLLSAGTAFFGGARPRASITVDGRPLGFNEFIYGETSVWDLERVEVFRGPQTSAQGVNSIAGATYVVTADPTFEPEVKAQAEIGNEERRRLSAAASGPIVEEELAGRVAVDFQGRDSFVDFNARPEDSPDPNEFENLVARGKLLWEPENLSTKLTFSFTQSEGTETQLVGVPFRDLESDRSVIWRTVAYAGLHDLIYAPSDSLEISNRFSMTTTENERFTDPGFSSPTRRP